VMSAQNTIQIAFPTCKLRRNKATGD